MSDASGSPATDRRHLGPIPLGPGVTAGNALSFVTVSIVSLGLLVFVNFMQPYLFYGQIAVASEGLGRITSRLSIVHELVVLASVGAFGALSDRLGRRIVFASGLVVVAAALALCSVVGDIAGLTVARLLYAVGAAATTATLAAVAADYPDDAGRGKFLGLLLVTQQLAILILVANGAARLPGVLVAHGMSKVMAGEVAFRAAAVVALLGAALAYAGLYRGVPAAPPRLGSTRLGRLAEGLRLVIAHARTHPRFMIVLLIAFIARGDAAIMTGFLSLWALKTATAAGIGATLATAGAGRLLMAVTLCGLASAGFVGWLADRAERLALLTVALVAAGLGNAAIVAVHGVGEFAAFAAVGLIALGETAVILCGQTILGEQAPPALRGAAVGVFGMCGSLGVLVLLFAGGWLFDAVAPQAPFVMLGLVNLAASVPVALVWLRPARDRHPVSTVPAIDL